MRAVEQEVKELHQEYGNHAGNAPDKSSCQRGKGVENGELRPRSRKLGYGNLERRKPHHRENCYKKNCSFGEILLNVLHVESTLAKIQAFEQWRNRADRLWIKKVLTRDILDL